MLRQVRLPPCVSDENMFGFAHRSIARNWQPSWQVRHRSFTSRAAIALAVEATLSQGGPARAPWPDSSLQGSSPLLQPNSSVEKASDVCFESVPGDAPLTRDISWRVTFDVFNLAKSGWDRKQGRI